LVEPATPIQKQGSLAAFGYRNFRYLWGSAFGMALGIMMEMVVIGWLVLELTGSPVLVGLVSACRYAGTALGPFFGALVDRFDRKRILLIVRGAAVIYAGGLAVLYYTSLLEIWHIFALVLLGSLTRGFQMPTTQALAADIVEGHNLASAVAMLMVGMSTSGIIGPLLGGYLYEQIEAGGCFVVMAGAYAISSLMLFPMRLTLKERPVFQESVWKSITDGVRYITNDRALSALMVYAALANLFIFPIVLDMMAVYAKDLLEVGASELGWLIAGLGLGRLIGALIISTLGRFRYKGRLLVSLMVAWPAFLSVLAFSKLFYVSLPLLVVLGAGHATAMAMVQLLLLTWASEEYRGRVMGVRMFVVVNEMIGSIVAGALTGMWGIATVIVINASLGFITCLATGFWAPEIRRRPS
jgi:MFS family permease